jgi:hypothetical protein
LLTLPLTHLRRQRRRPPPPACFSLTYKISFFIFLCLFSL